MTDISQNLLTIQAQIRQHCNKYHRDESQVELVAVGKKHSVEKILALAALDQQHFGENYLQEAEQKMAHIAGQAPALVDSLVWHFIGHIQSRKCKDIANLFSWVHTVDSIKVAKKLHEHRSGLPLNILLQVNIDNEPTKSGVMPGDLETLAGEVSQLSNLALRGLMIIPQTRTMLEEQRDVFRRCRLLLDQLNGTGHQMDQLSMGMTGDMEAAIAEGATQVRIGTALFGARPAPIG